MRRAGGRRDPYAVLREVLPHGAPLHALRSRGRDPDPVDVHLPGVSGQPHRDSRSDSFLPWRARAGFVLRGEEGRAAVGKVTAEPVEANSLELKAGKPAAAQFRLASGSRLPVLGSRL